MPHRVLQHSTPLAPCVASRRHVGAPRVVAQVLAAIDGVIAISTWQLTNVIAVDPMYAGAVPSDTITLAIPCRLGYRAVWDTVL